MSWKTSGKLLSGPPTGSNTNKLDPRFRPNLGGLNAFQREQQLVGRYGGREAPPETRKSEWDVLKENHRFIRDDEEPSEVSWEERLARAYESKLFKEFAMIDLKHFKSRRLALRWRTAEEVVDGIGEETCGSLRCKYHQPTPVSPRNNRSMWEDASTPGPSVSERGGSFRYHNHDDSRDTGDKRRRKKMPALRAFELPFVYEEAGARKEALVKVRLCSKCQAKLTWKPGKEEPESEDDNEERKSEKSKRGGSSDEEERYRARREKDTEATAGGRHRDRNATRRTRRHSSRDDDFNTARAGDKRSSPTGRQRSRSRSRSPTRRRDATAHGSNRRNLV